MTASVTRIEDVRAAKPLRSTPPEIRVLIVDDNPGDARLVERLLERADHHRFELRTAACILDGVRAVQDGCFEAVVMDVNLPDASGVEGLAELQRVRPNLPVVVLTGHQDERLALDLVAAGAQDCFVKGEVSGMQLARGIRFAIERKHAEQHLKALAKHDPLTGLANRSLYEDRLEQALARARRRQGRAALLFVDLDHFKNVNDCQGHETGDLLLCAMSARFEGCVRDCDTVARLGGDEFAIIIEDLPGPEAAERVAQSVLRAISLPFDLEGQRILTSGSIGIALYPDHGLGPTELGRNADAAMYLAKQSGRNQYCFSDRAPVTD